MALKTKHLARSESKLKKDLESAAMESRWTDFLSIIKKAANSGASSDVPKEAVRLVVERMNENRLDQTDAWPIMKRICECYPKDAEVLKGAFFNSITERLESEKKARQKLKIFG